jgi:hypothetical protein
MFCGEQSAIKETPCMLRIFNAYAVSGFYFGHAVYIRVEVIIPWRLFAYYCDSVAACHVILMAAILSGSCYAYLVPVCTRVVFFW